jgi:hypothetical protein
MNFKLNKALFISSIAVAFAAIFYFISSMAFDDHAEINPTEVATESQCVQTHRYYDYYFARGASLVQADCWTEAPDHYSCGRIDTLIAEAL